MIRGLLLTLIVCLLASCSGADRPAPAPTSTTRADSANALSQVAAQSTLDGLASAISHHNRAAFDLLVSDRDALFDIVSSRIYENLASMPLTVLTFRVLPRRRELSAQRCALFGPGAFVSQVAVTWRLSGDVGAAEHLLWLTFIPDGSAARLAGTADGPTERSAQPLWLVERVATRADEHTTTLAAVTGPGQTAATWTTRGNAAAAAVRKRLSAGLGAHWNSDLVIEIPSSRQVFEEILGVLAGSYVRIAAVAWPEGPDPTTAALRIVVNPDLAGRLDGQALNVLLTHEATHIATRSAASPSPTWLVEGFADFVAYDAYPRTSGVAAAALLAQVREHGAPRTLPSDKQFSASASDLPLVYAQSWLACRYLANRFSDVLLDRFYQQVDSGANVDQALRSVYGLSGPEFVKRWDEYLRTAAQPS